MIRGAANRESHEPVSRPLPARMPQISDISSSRGLRKFRYFANRHEPHPKQPLDIVNFVNFVDIIDFRGAGRRSRNVPLDAPGSASPPCTRTREGI
jgi:hypothetical protein